jgi:hypothetical protein
LRTGPTVEHDDNAVGRRPVHRKRNAHHEDVRVGSANASTQCRGRRGGVRDKENKRRWTFVPEQQSALDALASSSDPRTLPNHETCCSSDENVSK